MMRKAPLHVLGPTISFQGGTYLLEDVVDFQLRFFLQWHEGAGWLDLIGNSSQEDGAKWEPPAGSPLMVREGLLLIATDYDLYVMGMAVSDRTLSLRVLTRILDRQSDSWRTFSGPVLAEKGYALTQPIVARGGGNLIIEGSIGVQAAPQSDYTVDLSCILVRHRRGGESPAATVTEEAKARETLEYQDFHLKLASVVLERDEPTEMQRIVDRVVALAALKAGLDGPAGALTMLDQANNANHRAHTQLDEARVPQCGDLSARIAWLIGGWRGSDSSSKKPSRKVKRKAKKK